MFLKNNSCATNFYKAPSRDELERYDILIVFKGELCYKLYTNAPLEIPALEKEDGTFINPLLLTQKGFNEKLKLLRAKNFDCESNEDLSRFPDKWQRFYCDATPKSNKRQDHLIDQVEINLIDKKYIVAKNIDAKTANGYDFYDEVMNSQYVSPLMLEFLIKACESFGLKKIGGT